MYVICQTLQTRLIETIAQKDQDLSDLFNIFKRDEVSLNSMPATSFGSIMSYYPLLLFASENAFFHSL